MRSFRIHIILLLMLPLPVIAQDSIPNSGFERWEWSDDDGSDSMELPVGWEPINTDSNGVVKDSNAFQGDHALTLKNYHGGWEGEASKVISIFSLNRIPDSVSFFLKGDVDAVDTIFVSAQVNSPDTFNNVFWRSDTAFEEFQKVVFPYKFPRPDTAQNYSASISVQSGICGGGPCGSTRITVDAFGLIFDSSSASIADPVPKSIPWKIYTRRLGTEKQIAVERNGKMIPSREILTFNLYDVTGSQVLYEKFSSYTERKVFSISELSPGLYIGQLSTKSNVFTKKIVIR